MRKKKNVFRRKDFLNGILISIFAILFAFVILEIFFIFFLPQRLSYHQPDPFLSYRPIPGKEVNLVSSEYNVKTNFNSKGFNDYEYPTEKNSSAFRILVLGDSFIEALQVPRELNFPKQLEKKLNENDNGKKYEVLSFGVSSYATENEFMLLKREGVLYNPDLVIVAYFVNDFWENGRKGLFDVENGSLVEKTPLKISFVTQLQRACVSWSHVCRFLYFEIGQNPEIKNILLPPERRKDGNVTFIMFDIPREIFLPGIEENPNFQKSFEVNQLLLNEFKKISDKNNFETIFLFVPLREQVDQNHQDIFKRDFFSDTNKILIDQPQDILLEQTKKENISLIDLSKIMRKENINNSFYFNVDGHWNENGHKFVADYVFKILSEKNMIR